MVVHAIPRRLMAMGPTGLLTLAIGGFLVPAIAFGMWEQQVSNSPHRLLMLDAVTDHVAWAGGENAMVVVTTDGGANWEPVPIPGAGRIQGLVAFDGTRCVVADGTDTFWRTTNGGQDWNPVHSVPGTSINGIYFFDDENGWAIGDPIAGTFVIVESSDGGLTWSPSPGPPSGGGHGFWRSFDWVGTEIGAFGTNQWVIWRTTDGGASWDSVGTHCRYIPGLVLNDDGLGLAGGFSGGEAGVLDRSTDFGETWQQSFNAPAGQLLTFDWIEGTSEVWGIDNAAGPYHSTDGGLSWLHVPPSVPIVFEDIDFADLDTGWCVGWSLQDETGRIYRYSSTTGVSDAPLAGGALRVSSHPNPFADEVSLLWSAAAQPVDLSIYDAAGRLIWTATGLDRGYRWRGESGSGSVAPSGVYFYLVTSGLTRVTGRFIKAH
jgi:photosystem II stability/assembly factor-like uncharacterized protein